jgi:hypothetical protein
MIAIIEGACALNRPRRGFARAHAVRKKQHGLAFAVLALSCMFAHDLGCVRSESCQMTAPAVHK